MIGPNLPFGGLVLGPLPSQREKEVLVQTQNASFLQLRDEDGKSLWKKGFF